MQIKMSLPALIVRVKSWFVYHITWVLDESEHSIKYILSDYVKHLTHNFRLTKMIAFKCIVSTRLFISISCLWSFWNGLQSTAHQIGKSFNEKYDAQKNIWSTQVDCYCNTVYDNTIKTIMIPYQWTIENLLSTLYPIIAYWLLESALFCVVPKPIFFILLCPDICFYNKGSE